MLTRLDELLAELALRVGQLSKRSQVALFWSFASALQPEYRRWVTHSKDQHEPILLEALTVAHDFALSGIRVVTSTELLSDLEASVPAGESPDEISATAAQDCWICADVSIRVLADDNYNAAPAIEYAIEPMLQRATERIFGVSQVGSGEREREETEAILKDWYVSEAIEFLSWATDYLSTRSAPSHSDLELVRQRARVLAVKDSDRPPAASGSGG
jgi:hypothetical protein